MKTLRELYVETGAIVPAGMVQRPARPVLRMDADGHAAAIRHMEQERLAAEVGALCEIPLDQVPEYIVEAWERRERRTRAAA